MTTPLSEWTCFHCGERCGGRLPTGYRAILGNDGAIHASCSPDDPTAHPDCYVRAEVHGEPLGALRDVRPLPVGVEDIRKAAKQE